MNNKNTETLGWWSFFKREARVSSVDPMDKAVSIYKEKIESERLSKKEYKKIYMAAWNVRKRTIARAEKEFRQTIQELKMKNKKEKKNVGGK